MTVLLLSLIDAVMRPGAQPLLHCARSILFVSLSLVCFLAASFRSLFSSRSHLQHAIPILRFCSCIQLVSLPSHVKQQILGAFRKGIQSLDKSTHKQKNIRTCASAVFCKTYWQTTHTFQPVAASALLEALESHWQAWTDALCRPLNTSDDLAMILVHQRYG